MTMAEVVDPIVLSVQVHEPNECRDYCCCCCCSDIPHGIANQLSGTLCENDDDGRYLTVALGIFSVVRLVRPAQYLVHATEYCVPDKECISAEDDDPCHLFRSMAFPTEEFCPPSFNTPSDKEKYGHCGCHQK